MSVMSNQFIDRVDEGIQAAIRVGLGIDKLFDAPAEPVIDFADSPVRLFSVVNERKTHIYKLRDTGGVHFLGSLDPGDGLLVAL